MDKPQFSRQAKITAFDLSRDYRRISQPLIAGLWLQTCDCGQSLGLQVGEFWELLKGGKLENRKKREMLKN